MTKHTPGPWVADIFDVPYVRSAATGQQIMEALLCDPADPEPYATQDPAEALANIVLAAAAPDLLDALCLMLARFADHEQYDEDGADTAAIAEARAAIAKALG